jgi:hypothetical protein
MFNHTPSPYTHKELEAKLNDFDVIEYYFGFRPNTGEKITSPIRFDRTPNCQFSVYRGKLRFRDWKMDRPYDMWDLLQAKFNKSFAQVVDMVGRDLVEGKLSEKKAPVPQGIVNPGKKIIEVTLMPFKKVHGEYLSQFGITRKICHEFKVFAIGAAWVNGYQIYTHSDGDPCIGYFFGSNEFGDERWKLYFFQRERGHGRRSRFLGNTQRINGWKQLPERGSHLVITKSMKDVLTLKRLGVTAIAMQSEHIEPYPEIVEELQGRFDQLFSLFDFDRVGVSMAQSLRKKYNIKPLFLTRGHFGTRDWGAKDISDYVKLHGVEKVTAVVEHVCSIQRIQWTSP